MNRKLKNIILIVVLLLGITGIILTLNYAKNNITTIANEIPGLSSGMPSGEMPSGELSSGEKPSDLPTDDSVETK